jgi:hypothetical protein
MQGKLRRRGALQHVTALAEVVSRKQHHAYRQDHETQRERPREDRLPLVVAAPVFVRVRRHACGDSTHARQTEPCHGLPRGPEKTTRMPYTRMNKLPCISQLWLPTGARQAGGAPSSAAEMLPTVIDMFNLQSAPRLSVNEKK